MVKWPKTIVVWLIKWYLLDIPCTPHRVFYWLSFPVACKISSKLRFWKTNTQSVKLRRTSGNIRTVGNPRGGGLLKGKPPFCGVEKMNDYVGFPGVYPSLLYDCGKFNIPGISNTAMEKYRWTLEKDHHWSDMTSGVSAHFGPWVTWIQLEPSPRKK